MKDFVHKLWNFGLKQANAAIFGGLLLGMILLSAFVDLTFGGLTRYDILFLWAILVQILLIAFKLERKEEVLMIAIFHVVATLMELFKTSGAIGSWTYPDPAFFRILTVPLFAGFLYSAVGSYIARAWKIHKLRFTHYPPFWMTVVLAASIYINFFTHHFIWDMRWIIFMAVAAMFWRTWVYFTVLKKERRMPLLLAFVLIAFFLWVAENISTFSSVWLYPSQLDGWKLVSIQKMGAWFLLMIVSFVLITFIRKKTLYSTARQSTPHSTE